MKNKRGSGNTRNNSEKQKKDFEYAWITAFRRKIKKKRQLKDKKNLKKALEKQKRF